MKPLVTIIIVTWNGLELLKNFLPSVLNTTYSNYEIVVVDNASEDDTLSYLHSNHPEVRIIRNDENFGYARGNNEAIRSTGGEYIVLLNNDAEVDPGWLEPVVAHAESDMRIGVLQPKILRTDERNKFEYAGAAGGHLDLLGFPFALGRLFDTVESDRGQYDTPRQIFWASGAAFFARRSALERVGLLDEEFFMHMEEIDLCWRMWRHGFSVYSEPGSKVYHQGGGSLAYKNPNKLYYNVRNSLVMLQKNLPQQTVPEIFRLRKRIDKLATIRFAATGNFRKARAITRARRDAAKMMETMGTIRSTDTLDVLPSYRGSIVADYYMKRKKYFAQLDQSRFKFPVLPEFPM